MPVAANLWCTGNSERMSPSKRSQRPAHPTKRYDPETDGRSDRMRKEAWDMNAMKRSDVREQPADGASEGDNTIFSTARSTLGKRDHNEPSMPDRAKKLLRGHLHRIELGISAKKLPTKHSLLSHIRDNVEPMEAAQVGNINSINSQSRAILARSGGILEYPVHINDKGEPVIVID